MNVDLIVNSPRRVVDTAKYIKHRYFDKYVFIHINKTGGSSIEKALWLPFEHKTVKDKIKELGQSEWRKRYSFAVVRNPWDKVVSHYHYRVQTNQTMMGDGHISFAEWVEAAYGDRDPRYYDQPLMFAPQSEWLDDGAGKVAVNKILRFENLTDEFNELAKYLKIKRRLPHIKKSNRSKNYKDYYNDRTYEIVRKRFARDIENFGYKC